MQNSATQVLEKRVEELENIVKGHQESIENKDRMIEQLQEALKLALARKYGRASESYVDPNQTDLFDEVDSGVIIDNDSGEMIEVPGYTRNKTRPKRAPLPDYLPREVIEYKLPEEALVLPNGLRYEVIGEEISEQLDVIPQDVRVIKHVRYKYAIKGYEEYGIKTAPMTTQVIGKSIASNGLLAHIVQAKYCHHLPLYRQQKIWQELEVDLARSSMCRWMRVLGEKVQPVVNDIMAQIKLLPYLQADETPVTVLKDKDHPAGPHTGYMWAYNNSAGTVFKHASRAGENVWDDLSDYTGYVQSDAYSGYNILFGKDSNRVRVGCWAHARRKYMDVIKAQGKAAPKGVSHEMVELIAKLYAIERKAIKDGRTTHQLKAIRQIKAKPILDKIKKRLDEIIHLTPPKGLLGKAISYTLNNWESLSVYIQEGFIPIDNNATENKIRPFAVGRKNWLFSGHTESAKASANLFTLVENAKLYNIKVFDYLKYVFNRIGDAKSDKDFEALTPKYASEHLPKIRSAKRG